LDLESARLTVSRIVTVADGRAIVGQPKTAAGRRMIALDPNTVEALRAHRRRQAEERLAAGPAWADNDLLFCWEDGTPIHPHNPTRWFAEITAELDLPHIRLHGLRHTYATVALKAGVDIKVLSARLGHASTTVTRELYQHVTPEMDEDAAATVAHTIFGQ
ncbi:MAG: site-specific integrase, partial [Nitriliruptorales bacterium]|nr:site-specific integrase [Nitriliruptorales bacterium]